MEFTSEMDAGLFQHHVDGLPHSRYPKESFCGCRGALASSGGNEITLPNNRNSAMDQAIREIHQKTHCLRAAGKRWTPEPEERWKASKNMAHISCIQVSQSCRDPRSWHEHSSSLNLGNMNKKYLLLPVPFAQWRHRWTSKYSLVAEGGWNSQL